MKLDYSEEGLLSWQITSIYINGSPSQKLDRFKTKFNVVQGESHRESEPKETSCYFKFLIKKHLK